MLGTSMVGAMMSARHTNAVEDQVQRQNSKLLEDIDSARKFLEEAVERSKGSKNAPGTFNAEEEPISPGANGDAEKTMNFFERKKEGKLAFLESTLFQSIVAVVIALNCLCIGWETDATSEELTQYLFLERVFLVFFVFELTLRLLRYRSGFFCCKARDGLDTGDVFWNWLDFVLVLAGIVALWIEPVIAFVLAVSKEKMDTLAGELRIVRILRLLRIVRIVRLVKVIRPLYTLSQGMLAALQGMFWVYVLVMFSVFSASVLCTRLIGQGIIVDPTQDIHPALDLPTMTNNLATGVGSDDSLSKSTSRFSTVPTSMWTVFETMSGWTLTRFEPLFHEVPACRLAFILWYIYSAWTLLSVLTGVVTENIIMIHQRTSTEDEEVEELRRLRAVDCLEELFDIADLNGNGNITKQEFDVMLENADALRLLRKHTRVRLSDLGDLFDVLDEDKDGSISLVEFLAGFHILNEDLAAKSFMKMKKSFKREIREVRASWTRAQDMQRRRSAGIGAALGALRAKAERAAGTLQDIDQHCAGCRAIADELTATFKKAHNEAGVTQAQVNQKRASLISDKRGSVLSYAL